MARNPHLNKPNGGALKPSATMGRPEKIPMDRMKPFASFLNDLDDDTRDDVLADKPDDVDAAELTRAYLVEIRAVEKTWADSHESYALAWLYYVTPSVDRVVRVQTTTGITDDGQGGYELTAAARDEYQSSILTASDGRPHPDSFYGTSPAAVREQYRRVLRDEHSLDIPSAESDDTEGDA